MLSIKTDKQIQAEELEKRNSACQKYILDFFKALKNNDILKCEKDLGVLEYLKAKDVPYFSGVVFYLRGDSQQASFYLKKVSKRSRYYAEAKKMIAAILVNRGSFFELKNELETDNQIFSLEESIAKLLMCVAHMEPESIDENASMIENSFPNSFSCEMTADNAESRYGIYRTISDSLFAVGLCIEQGLIYAERVEEECFDISKAKDMSAAVCIYRKFVFILSLVDRMGLWSIVANRPDAYTEIALKELSWNEKIKKIKSIDYVRTFANVLVRLNNPDIHPYCNRYLVIEHMCEIVLPIEPKCLAQIVNQYFDDFVSAYKQGETSAIQYIGYVFSEIIATDEDLFCLKDRIEKFWSNSFNMEETVKQIQSKYFLSRKGHDSLLNAERMYEETCTRKYGIEDASALSLSFFRVIEMEYNTKIISPLASKVDFSVIQNIKTNMSNWDKEWKKDIESIKKSAQGMSIEIGTCNFLIKHILMRNDACAQYLRPILEGIFSAEGKAALTNGDVCGLIDGSLINRFRNPAAHTGYIPYSVACECRDHVYRTIEEMMNWF